MKNVLLLGCPSLEWKIVSAAKRLRKFFQVREQTVSFFLILFYFIWLSFGCLCMGLLTRFVANVR